MDKLSRVCLIILMSIGQISLFYGQEKIIQTDSMKALSAKSLQFPKIVLSDTLPLAPNKNRSIRPVFETPHFDLSFGVMDGEFPFKSLSPVSGHKLFVPLSVFVDFPLIENPDVSIMGGLGFALGGVAGGSYILYSALILYRPDIPCPVVQPFFGFGMGHSRYEHSNGIIVKASQSYPMLAIGVNIVPDRLDAMLLLPATGYLVTYFENDPYSACLAGPGLKLIWHLREL